MPTKIKHTFVFFACVLLSTFFAANNAINYQCLPGKFNDEAMDRECYPCKPGSVSSGGALQDAPLLVNLIDGGNGKFFPPSSWNTGDKRCLFCNPGTYANTAGTACETCPVNSYNIPSLTHLFSSKDRSIKVDVSVGGFVDPTIDFNLNFLTSTRCAPCSQGFLQPNPGQAIDRNSETRNYDSWYSVPFPVVRPDSPFPVYDASGNVVLPRNFTFADIITPSGMCSPIAPGSYRTLDMATPAFCPAGTYSAGPEGDEVLTFADTMDGMFVLNFKVYFYFTGFFEDVTFHGALPVVGNNGELTFIKIGGGNPIEDCRPCPEGTSSTTTGLASKTQCEACPVGHYGELKGNDGSDGKATTQQSRVCTACPPGSYAAETKTISCTPAEAGKFASTAGATSSTSCPVGTYSTGNTDHCTQCIPGMFANETGSASCTKAFPGTYISASGWSSDPLPCPKGTFSTSSGLDVCAPCAPGYYSNITGAISCSPSPPGSFVAIAGEEEPFECPNATFSALASKECTPCVPGSYGPFPNSAACTLCPSGYFSTTTGSDSNATCIACDEGQYNPLRGSNSSSQCLLCEPGTYSAKIGSPMCTPADEGYIVATAGAIAPTICQGGSYSNVKGLAACLSCRAGSYSLKGAAFCTLCDAGSFSSALAANSPSTCEPCPAGSFQPTPGSATCLLCNPGSFAPTNGSIKCLPCPYGTASPVYGENSSSCAPCDAGHYAFPGFAACKPCWAGSYTADTGSSSCTACLEGTFSTQIGATSASVCQSCGANTYSFGGSACASCPTIPATTFVSPTRGCVPTGSSPVPDFFLSGSEAEGLVGMQLVNNPINVTFVPDFKGVAGGAIHISEGAFLALKPSSTSAIALALPSGTAGDLTISANIKCAPESPSMVAVQWGGNASSALNELLSITVGAGGLTVGAFDNPSAVNLGTNPTNEITISKDGKTIYSLYNGVSPSVTATDIDTTIVSALRTTNFMSLIRPRLSPDESVLYYLQEYTPQPMGSPGNNEYEMMAMTIATKVETKIFTRMESWKSFCISADNQYIFIAYHVPPMIKVYQLANLQAAPESLMSTTSVVTGMCLSPNGQILYVKQATSAGSTITAHNRNDGSPLQSFTAFTYSITYDYDKNDMLVTDDGKYLAFSIYGNRKNSLIFIDAATGAVKGIVGDDTEFGNANTVFLWPVTNGPTVNSLHLISQIPGKMSFMVFAWDDYFSSNVMRLDLAPAKPGGGPCDGTWHHMANVYSASAGTASFILDGVLKSVTDVSTSRRRRQLAANTLVLPSAGDSMLAIGWNGDLSVKDGAVFTGSISDVRVYATAVSVASLSSITAIVVPTYENAINPGGYVAGVNSYSWSCMPGFYGPELILSKNSTVADGGWMYSTPSAPDAAPFLLSTPLSTLCSPCGAGSYAPVASLASCLLCDAGTYSSNTTGAISCEGMCPVGTYSTTQGAQSMTACEPCPLGYFTNASGSTTCNVCPLGNSTKSVGSIGCSECDAGTYTHINGSITTCVPCEKGFYSSDSGVASCSGTCAAGTYNNLIGQTSVSACLECEAGTSSVPGSFKCTPCPAGFSSIRGAACVKCLSGSVSTTVIPNGPTTCTSCGTGTFANAFTNNQCLPCGRGTYSMSSATGSSQCTPCAPGTFTNSTSSNACDACPAGSWSSYGYPLCTPCNPGTSSLTTSATSASTCINCNAGYFSASAGAQSCTSAPQGFFVATAGQAIPTACSAGEYRIETASTLPCLQCPKGSFQSEVGAPSCTVVEGGYFVPTVGATKPEICLAGSFSLPGATECTQCSPGSFSSLDGSATCTLSSPGNYSFLSGSTTEYFCPSGSFSGRGASACTVCPTGDAYSTSLLPGSTSCNCSMGSAWDGFNQVCNAAPKGQSVTLTFSYIIPALCSGSSSSLLNLTNLILDPASGISSALRTSIASAAGYDPSAASVTAVSICNTTFFVVVPNATVNTVLLTNQPPASTIATQLLGSSSTTTRRRVLRSQQQQQQRVLISKDQDFELISAVDEIAISIGIIMPQLLVAPVANFLEAVVVKRSVDPAVTSSLANGILSTLYNAPSGSIVTSGSISNGGALPSTLSSYFLAALVSVVNASASNNVTFPLVSSLQAAALSAVVPMLNSSNLPANTPVTSSLKNIFVGGFVYFIAPSSTTSTVVSASNADTSSSSQTTAIVASVLCVFAVLLFAFCCWRRRKSVDGKGQKDDAEVPTITTSKDITTTTTLEAPGAFKGQNPYFSKA